MVGDVGQNMLTRLRHHLRSFAGMTFWSIKLPSKRVFAIKRVDQVAARSQIIVNILKCFSRKGDVLLRLVIE